MPLPYPLDSEGVHGGHSGGRRLRVGRVNTQEGGTPEQRRIAQPASLFKLVLEEADKKTPSEPGAEPGDEFGQDLRERRDRNPNLQEGSGSVFQNGESSHGDETGDDIETSSGNLLAEWNAMNPHSATS
ncbi:MAG TPA: hypothetical protein VMW62_01025 [Chloroflexota bacterium]|nr:hypothetical protein [Chloroflexota bacterium]